MVTHILVTTTKTMRTISLTKNQVTVIDDHHFDWVSQHKWCASSAGKYGYYAYRKTSRLLGNSKVEYLHRKIMEHILGRPLTDDEEVDHVDLDKLNNLDNNLRLASYTENMCNKGIRDNNTSGFKGVSWFKRDGKWRSQIQVNSKNRHIGYFSDKEDAARAYDRAAKELHGEFAYLNFPNE